MRKRVIFCILVIYTLSSCAGKELDGIFDLKIGMTESQLREVVDISLLERKENTEEEKDVLSDRLKKFKLDHYVSADNNLIEKIDLYFLDDKLFYINIGKYNADIEKMLTENYGKPKVIKVEDEKPKNKDSLTSVTQEWKTNTNHIACWSSVDFYVDRSILAYFLLIEDIKTYHWVVKQFENHKKELE